MSLLTLACIDCHKIEKGIVEDVTEYVCFECASPECQNCHERFTKGDVKPVMDNDGTDLWCENCIDEGAQKCDNCDNLMHEWTDVDGNKWCRECTDDSAHLCERCGNYSTESIEVHTVNSRGRVVDQYWCDHCADTNSDTCRSCREYFTETTVIDDGIYCESCGTDAYYCGSCDTRSFELCSCNEGEEGLHCYTYKPPPIFYPPVNPSTNEVTYYGLEIEMVGKRVGGKRSFNDTDYIYYKQDATVDAELVTHPFTYEWFMKTGRAKLQNELKKCIDHDYEAYESSRCGIHIHVSRNAYTPLHLARLLTFVRGNKNLIQKLSRRKGGMSYCNPDCEMPYTVSYTAKYGLGFERYSAINCNNTATIEWRIFQSNLKIDGVHYCLDVVRALTAYLKTDNGTEKGFLKFVEKTPKAYEHLAAWLRKENMIKKPNAIKAVNKKEIPTCA